MSNCVDEDLNKTFLSFNDSVEGISRCASYRSFDAVRCKTNRIEHRVHSHLPRNNDSGFYRIKVIYIYISNIFLG